MNTPLDQEAAKIRIRLRRLWAERSAALEAFTRANSAYEAEWSKWLSHCRKTGRCPLCELPDEECKGHGGGMAPLPESASVTSGPPEAPLSR